MRLEEDPVDSLRPNTPRSHFPRAWQNCWVESQNGKINGVLRAGPRSGKQAWEISELYLRNSKSSLILDLLEQIAVQAGGAGAYRIFIRIPVGSNALISLKKPVFLQSI
ncbi:MAG: hypothetical protein CM1200mP39_10320 [Dehalococcoidia bacterium]|nr:MAG: hypothetical protein CM1200mP39_10320 [Dehalococcoidia bacterium]